jgi:hypothetical protein
MSQLPPELPPLPVVALPAQPEYAHLANLGSARPTVVTFIGVISVMLGCVGILAGLAFGLLDCGLLIGATAATTIRTMPHTSASTTRSGSSSERVASEGLSSGDRRKIAVGLQLIRPLSQLQLQQLDQLLAEHGQAIFGPVDSFTPPMLAKTVARSGHVDSAGTGGSDYFALGAGRLELWDDRAIFLSVESQLPLRSVAIQLPGNPNVNLQGKADLSDDQLRSVFRTIDDLNAKPITAAQRAALITLLRSPGEQILTPATDGSDPAWEIGSAFTMPDGTLNINTTHGSANGTISSTLSLAANGSTTQSNFSRSSTATAAAFSMPSVDVHAARATLLLTIMQLLLSVFLLVAGIFALRGSPHARRLHWSYVGLKLPLGIMTAAASAWMWKSFFASMGLTMPAAGRSLFRTSMWFGLLPAALGCIYPIVLCFLLRTRTARQFYGTRSG